MENVQRPIDRFNRRVRKLDGPDPCWIWTGAKDDRGYGRMFIEGRNQGAHRASYLLHHGPIRRAQVVRHKCDNPSCVNPDHLEAGTYKENAMDFHVRVAGRTQKKVALQAAFTESEAEAVRRMAADEGLSVSEFIREAVILYANEEASP